MKTTDNVLLMVIVDGTHVGNARNVAEVESMIRDHVDYPNYNADYLQDHVEVYPLLSAEPIEFDFADEGEYEVDTDESHHGEPSYTITDIDESFDTEEELQEWIKSALEDGDYTEEQVKWWDIEMTMTYNVTVEIESDKEVIVSANIPTVGEYVKIDEASTFHIEEELAKNEPHYEDTDKPLPPPTVSVATHVMSPLTYVEATQAIRKHEAVYSMNDRGNGEIVFDTSEMDDAVANGYYFAKMLYDRADLF